MGLRKPKSSVGKAGGSRGKTAYIFQLLEVAHIALLRGPASSHNTLTTVSVITSPCESPASFFHL